MAKAKENEISAIELQSRMILREGIDLQLRELVLEGNITHKMFRNLDRQMKLLETFSNEPITILLNSGGGEVYAAFAIVDRLASSSCEINIVGTGLVASAAVAILASCDKRQITRNTTIMHHSCSFDLGYDRLPSQDTVMKHIKDLEKRFCSILANRTKKPYSFWVSNGKHTDFYFNADTALEFGLVDEIL